MNVIPRTESQIALEAELRRSLPRVGLHSDWVCEIEFSFEPAPEFSVVTKGQTYKAVFTKGYHFPTKKWSWEYRGLVPI